MVLQVDMYQVHPSMAATILHKVRMQMYIMDVYFPSLALAAFLCYAVVYHKYESSHRIAHNGCLIAVLACVRNDVAPLQPCRHILAQDETERVGAGAGVIIVLRVGNVLKKVRLAHT